MIRKAYLFPMEAYKVIRMQGRGSLDRQNFGPRRDLLFFFWRFLDSGKFILAVIIFPGKMMQHFFETT